ncbi:glycosyltransferase family 2 protein [Enterococcus bulliens]
MQNELISIIVPVYNAEKYIEKCLNSLLEQTYENIEILVIDDGSKDDSKRKILKLMSEDSRIRYIYTENSGVSNARNLGIKESNGYFFMFVDSDDFVHQNFCEFMYTRIKKDKTDICFCNFFLIDKKKRIVSNKLPIYPEKILSQKEAIYSVIGSRGYKGFVWNKIYSKNLISKNTFYEDIHYLEDMLFNVNLLSNVKRISVIQEALYYYTINPESAVNNFSAKQLTYLDGLNEVKKVIKNKEFDFIIFRHQEIAIIEFARKSLQIKNKTLYLEMKQLFKFTSKKTPLLKVMSTDSVSLGNNLKNIIRLISRLNFFIGVRISMFFFDRK